MSDEERAADLDGCSRTYSDTTSATWRRSTEWRDSFAPSPRIQ